MNIVGRTRRMDTKQFTVTIDVTANQNQDGIVRIFLGPRINNQQQLNDNRNNFVELDQFIVQLNNGQNIIKRNSIDFKNVVGDAQTMGQLYQRAMNTLNGKNGNNMNNLNMDTCNNNQGFPHRLVLPKGTIGGQDYTLFVVINKVKTNGFNYVQYHDDLITANKHNNNDGNNNGDSNGSSDSNSSSNESSNSSNDSNDSNESNNQVRNNNGNKNGNNMNNGRNFNNGHKNGNNGHNNMNQKGNNKNMNNNNWGKTNGVKIFNLNNGNKNVGNGNGVLDNRAMGFPLDRQIIDVTGFITKNMFFKNVVVYHIDNSMNNNQNKNGQNNNY